MPGASTAFWAGPITVLDPAIRVTAPAVLGTLFWDRSRCARRGAPSGRVGPTGPRPPVRPPIGPQTEQPDWRAPPGRGHARGADAHTRTRDHPALPGPAAERTA